MIFFGLPNTDRFITIPVAFNLMAMFIVPAPIAFVMFPVVLKRFIRH